LILEMEFAVILLDVNMPDIDGLETASLIRHYKKSAQTPIVFITAYVDELQAKRATRWARSTTSRRPWCPGAALQGAVFVELHRMNRQLQQQAVEREALARSEAARTAAEEAIHRADYLSEASQRLSRRSTSTPRPMRWRTSRCPAWAPWRPSLCWTAMANCTAAASRSRGARTPPRDRYCWNATAS
jgi:CheY-like chemotaxis protein